MRQAGLPPATCRKVKPRGRAVARAAMLAALGAAVVSATGCQQLLFRQDNRITVTAPADYSSIREPVVISWNAVDFTPGPDGTFCVFVDRAPMPPGESLDYFSARDRDGIFQTTNSHIRFDVLNDIPSNPSAERNYHQITVVLLDRSGHRIGEEAGFVEFTDVTHQT